MYNRPYAFYEIDLFLKINIALPNILYRWLYSFDLMFLYIYIYIYRKNPQHALGEVKPSVPCRRFAACKRSLNLCGSRNWGKISGQFLAHNSTFRYKDLSLRCGRTGTWRRKWERLKEGESNGKLPPRSCPGCSVPEPYRSHDWALVPANPASKAEY
jgi:hypothetical protein